MATSYDDWRVMSGPDDPRHGTAGGYTNQGCRCEQCCRAHSDMCQERRLKRGEEGLPPGDPRHGYSGYTNWICRCDICREANNEYARNYARRRR